MANKSKDIGAPAPAIWVIERTRHFRDRDNYDASESSIEVDEGFHLSQEAAGQHAEKLNASLRAAHEESERQRQLEHKRQNKAVQRHNSEAAAVRAAGMNKADMALPKPFKPKTFAEFRLTTEHTIYEAVAIERAADGPSPETTA